MWIYVNIYVGINVNICGNQLCEREHNFEFNLQSFSMNPFPCGKEKGSHWNWLRWCSIVWSYQSSKAATVVCVYTRILKDQALLDLSSWFALFMFSVREWFGLTPMGAQRLFLTILGSDSWCFSRDHLGPQIWSRSSKCLNQKVLTCSGPAWFSFS